MNRLILILALLLPTALQAQTGLSKSLTVAGITTTNAGSTFAWIALQPTDTALLSGKQIAVYRKSGNAASANAYARVAVIQAEADIHTVGSLIARAGQLGENLTELHTVLTELLQEAAPGGSISTAQLMSTLISSAWGHADKMKRVMLLARQRPSVALCAGFAHTEKIPAAGVLTYELRDFNTTTQTDNGVLGRHPEQAGEAEHAEAIRESAQGLAAGDV